MLGKTAQPDEPTVAATGAAFPYWRRAGHKRAAVTPPRRAAGESPGKYPPPSQSPDSVQTAWFAGLFLRAQLRTRTGDPFPTISERERTFAGCLRVSTPRVGHSASVRGWLWVGPGRLRLP